jgi:hypothetical protein
MGPHIFLLVSCFVLASLDPTDVIHVEKFNGQKFQLWKFQMTFIFKAIDVWYVVNGGETWTIALHKDAWDKKDK